MLAIAGGKGGCGKTTTALGLAAALARDGASPTVVDADLDSPDVHLLADATPPSQVASEDATDDQPPESPLLGSTTPEAAALESGVIPGVSVVPAEVIDDGCVQTALERFAAVDGPVLVDCPAGASRDAIAPLRASDEVLLATTLSPPSLRDAAKTAAMADRLDADLLGVVLTRVPRWAQIDEGGPAGTGCASEIRPGIVRRVERLLDVPIIGQVPRVDCDRYPPFVQPVVHSSYDRLTFTLLK